MKRTIVFIHSILLRLKKNNSNILDSFKSAKGKVAVLIDPEKNQNEADIIQLINKINFSNVDFIFIGGSTVSQKEFEFTSSIIKKHTSLPLVIFPGSSNQISSEADGILFLSLLSGRNPDFLIGHHVQAIPTLLQTNLEIISTAYLLIDGESPSSVAYISQTTPIPRNHTKIAVETALAGIFQGKQIVFFDAGSGANKQVPIQTITELRKHTQTPILVGGGIRSVEQIQAYHEAGVNVVVIGNHIEEQMNFLLDLHEYMKKD